MEKVLLSILAASELCALFSFATYQFEYVCDRKTMPEAQRYCREKYVDLATIRNMEDVKTIRKIAKNADCSKLAWIGLYDEKDAWRWSLTDRSFYRDGEAEFRKWQGPRSGARCVIMDKDGLWRDKKCGKLYKAICYGRKKGLNEEYFLIKNSMNWNEAQSYCREHHTDLASVRNQTENQKIQELISKGEAWIGLFRESWKWSDGSYSSFRYWNGPANQPNGGMGEACVMASFYYDGQWEDWHCDAKSAFICRHAHRMQVVKIKVKKNNPSLDLNDPAVLEDILKQLKQKLKDQGVTDDVHLSWVNQPHVFRKEENEEKEEEKKEEEKSSSFDVMSNTTCVMTV